MTADQSNEQPEVHLRNYFETDFPTKATVRYELAAVTQGHPEAPIQLHAQAHLDFESHTKFCSFFVPRGHGLSLLDVCKALFNHAPDVLALRRGNQVTLPKAGPAWTGAGLEIQATEFLELALKPLEGGRHEASEFAPAPPIYIYADEDLTPSEIDELTHLGRKFNMTVRFRGRKYAMDRVEKGQPVAFISHDSRDKDDIARPLAIALSRLGHSVWFDEFSLKPGDRLRESIEDGIKKCKRCVLILTPNFLSNNGWGKTEFNSIFTREILEEQALVIPVWAGISKHDVYAYSPSLLNVVGAHWDQANSEACVVAVGRALEK